MSGVFEEQYALIFFPFTIFYIYAKYVSNMQPIGYNSEELSYCYLCAKRTSSVFFFFANNLSCYYFMISNEINNDIHIHEKLLYFTTVITPLNLPRH